MPSAARPPASGAKRARLSAMVALMLRFEKVSEAEAKIATSSACAARAAA
jgi:hypothetical protein